MGFGKAEDGKAFREVGFGPCGKLGLGFGVGFDEACQTDFGVGPVVGVEDGGDVGGHFAFQFLLGDVLLSILLEVELTALPRRGCEAGFERGAQTGVSVGGDEVGDADASLAQAACESAPVNFGFGQGAGHAENHSFAIVTAHADGDEGGAISYRAVDSHFVIGSVESEVGDLGKGALTPFLELAVEFGGELGYLGGGNLEAAEFFHYFRDAPGADAFDIHGGDSGLEGPVATRSLFEERRSERDVALTDLRNFDIQFAHGGLEAAGLEAVGVSVALFDVALVGFGTDVGDSFEKHGGVHEEFADFRDGVFDAVFEKQVDEIGMLIILIGFVHGFLLFLVCTFSIKSWTGTDNPRGGRRAAAEAADSATLHRPLLRRAGSGGLTDNYLHHLPKRRLNTMSAK